MASSKWIKWAACILSLALLAGFLYKSQDRRIDPNLVFITTRGEQFTLSQWQGSPVLVMFWASNCVSCLTEMPILDGIYRDYAPKGLKMIGVAMAYDMPSRVLDLANGLAYPNSFDLNGRYALAFSGVDLVPDIFLIDAKGKLVWHTLGLFEVQALKLKIETLLAEV